MRRFWVVVFCGLGLMGLVTAALAGTATLTALDRDAVAKAAARTYKNEAVQTQLVEDITTAVLRTMPPQGRTESATNAIRSTAKTVVTDPAFKQLWLDTVTQAYDVTFTGAEGPVVIDPTTATELITLALQASRPQVAELLPSDAQFEIGLGTTTYPDLQPEAKQAQLVLLGGAGTAIVGYGLALIISRQRRRTIRGSGWWMIGAGVLTLALVFTGPRWIAPNVFADYATVSSGLAAMGWRLYLPAALLTLLGVIVAAIGVAITRRAPENRITRTSELLPEAADGQAPVEAWDCKV